MKKSYIYPHTEVFTISGTAVMLGASGDMHSKTIGEGSQELNFAPAKVF